MKTVKKVITALLALMLLFTFFSCNNSDDSNIPSDILLAQNDAVDYVFFYPNTWELDRNDGMIVIKPISLKTGIASASTLSVTAFSLASDKISYGVNEEWAEYESELKKAFPSYTFKKSNDDIKLGGVVASQKEYTIVIAEQTYRFAQIICIRNAYVYQMTFCAIDTEYDANIKVVETVLQYFKFK
ncbi:MAG: hypothetical protein RR057_06770 [Clostridia bacterium]